MPLHSHPLLRAREEAMELDGQVKALDSDFVAFLKLAETVNGRPKVVPKVTYVIRTTVYKAK